MDQDEPTPGEPPTVPPSLAQRRELTQSVRFDRQPDGHFRAVLVDKPPKSLAEIMTGLLRGLPPAVRDASLSPPPESPPVDSPMGEEVAGQMSTPSSAHAERVSSPDSERMSSPDASRRGFHIDGRDLRRAKKAAARARLAGGAQRVMGAGASDETGGFDDADGLEEGEVFSGTSESPRSGSGGGTSKSPRPYYGFRAFKSPRSGPGSGSGPSPEAMEGVEYLVTGGKKYMPHEGMPEWYQQVTALEERELKKRRPQEIIALEALKTCITRCEDVEKKRDHGALQQLHEELRNHVHKAEVTLRMERAKTKVSRILTTQNGLPRIFSGDGGLPHDLKADAFQLYSRWWCGNFDQDLLRGIIIKKGKDRNGDRIDPEYRKLYPTTAKFYGDDGFVLGQWWPTQLCAVRDGAHGAAQGGKFIHLDLACTTLAHSLDCRHLR
jgi:hypothetical protein